MTKRRYLFGDAYILRQMRLGHVTYEVFPEDKCLLVHVRGARPLLVVAADRDLAQ
jgi:hypothetical protein